MNPVEVTYKNIETDDYKDFLYEMEQRCNSNQRKDNNYVANTKNIQKVLKTFSSSGLDFYSALESAHSFTQKAGKYFNRLYDYMLINELSKYNCSICGGAKNEFILDRIQKDLVLLLCVRSQYHYMLAWNDSDPPHVGGLFHAEGYRHLIDGIKKGIEKKSFKVIYDESNRLQQMEVFRRRAAALNYISTMLLLYLYSCYKTFGNLDVCAEALVWLIKNGYSWFSIPRQPEHEYLLLFTLMDIPDVGFGFPKDTMICDVYETVEEYKNSILGCYRGCNVDLRDIISSVQNLDKKFWDWKE